MDAAIQGLHPLMPEQVVQISLEQLRSMTMEGLVQLAYQLGIDVQKVRVERGKLLTEIVKYAVDA